MAADPAGQPDGAVDSHPGAAAAAAAASASIVFTSAAAGRRGEAYWGAYGVAYGGIEGLSRTWADEVEANTSIRFNTIDPGAVDTPMRRESFPGEVKGAARSPDNVTAAYLYLMGDDSREVRGQAISL